MGKHRGRIDLCFDDAVEALNALIGRTMTAIDAAHKKGDSLAIAKLAFEQRHNLKVLFERIERAKK